MNPRVESRQTVGGSVYEVRWSYFVTPRGGAGIRRHYTIDGRKVTRLAFEAAQQAAAVARFGNARQEAAP